MPLPKCVKVDLPDVSSQTALVVEGWRPVGTLLTYVGEIEWKPNHRVRPCKGRDVIDIMGAIAWSGRLWRDPQIPRRAAWEEMARFLECTTDDVYHIDDAAFMVCTESEIRLIGVHPVARGLGLAEAIIRDRFRTKCQAGTYQDNMPARKLYESLGMTIIKRSAVFHK